MKMRNQTELPSDAGRPTQSVSSNEASTTARTDNSWQEEAALFLLSSGFRPGATVGEVRHVATPERVGLTLGSVWRAMRSQIEKANPRV